MQLCISMQYWNYNGLWNKRLVKENQVLTLNKSDVLFVCFQQLATWKICLVFIILDFIQQCLWNLYIDFNINHSEVVDKYGDRVAHMVS